MNTTIKTLALLLALVTSSMASAYDFEVDGIYYFTSGNMAVVTNGDGYNSYHGQVTIPTSVTHDGTTYEVKAIGKHAFLNCNDLTSVDIPATVTTIGVGAFYQCSALTGIVIPNSVTAIDDVAFGLCSALTSVSLGSHLASIGENVFTDCNSLTSIVIPRSVNTIVGNPFYRCTSLSLIEVEDGNTAYDSRNHCNALIETATGTLLTGCHTTVIPDGVVTIGDYAFYSLTELTSVDFPGSVREIGSYAFYGCSGLNSVTFGSGMESIKNYAFWGCSNLQEVDFPDAFKFLGNNAFEGCSALTRVSTGDGLSSIGNDAFSNCAALDSVAFGQSIKVINSNAFQGCTSLRSAILPDDMEAIGHYAFSYSGISRLYLGKNLSGGIGEHAFEWCTNLTSVIVPEGVVNLNSDTFHNCLSLAHVSLPSTLKRIGSRAFANCEALNEITIPDGVTTIYSRAFFGCTGMTSIVIPDSVTDLSSEVFVNCTGLTQATIGKSVRMLESGTFAGCQALSTVYCKAVEPPIMFDNAFARYSDAVLYVPTESVQLYKNAMNWESFGLILGMDFDDPGDEDGYEYIPFVRESVKWVYSIYDYRYQEYETNPARGDNKIYRTLELRGDTIINGKTYKAMHMCVDDVYSEPSDVIPVYLREEDKMVYGIVPDGKYYDDAKLGYLGLMPEWNEDVYSGEEFLLYDFQDPIAYWDNLINDDLQQDTVEVGGHYVKRIFDERQEGDYFQVIEGIGAMGINSYPLAFLMPVCTGIHCTEYYRLEKVLENGEVIYPQNYVEDRYLPVIREGVQWVNVHVVINDGDTTKNYYTYEFKGNYPERDSYDRVFKAVYSQNCTANGISYGEERLVAGLREDEALILSFRNEPLNGMTNLINFYTYQGNEDVRLLHENLDEMWDIDYYINSQAYPHMNLLSTDNFVKADPIMIDGILCSRIAYIGEQGDTLAYLVEGIGFDSRDMGDLLTPFTRYPEADCGDCYQEYCGLSHVIKDGKIIYKGLHYRPIVPGDVNGDGEVNVADANSVIDIVVMGGNSGHTRLPAADVNNDNEINIADVNAIIDLILSQNH